MKGKTEFFQTLRMLFVAFGLVGLLLGLLLGFIFIVGIEIGDLSQSSYLYLGIPILFLFWLLSFLSKKADNFIRALEAIPENSSITTKF